MKAQQVSQPTSIPRRGEPVHGAISSANPSVQAGTQVRLCWGVNRRRTAGSYGPVEVEGEGARLQAGAGGGTGEQRGSATVVAVREKAGARIQSVSKNTTHEVVGRWCEIHPPVQLQPFTHICLSFSSSIGRRLGVRLHIPATNMLLQKGRREN